VEKEVAATTTLILGILSIKEGEHILGAIQQEEPTLGATQ